MKKLILLILTTILYIQFAVVHGSTLDREDVRGFIDEMSKRHGFSLEDLNTIFQEVEFSNSVIKAISKPAEALPWYKYRPIFIESARVRSGVEFWRRNQETLRLAEARFGVPAEFIVAIIGVETRYGKNTGSYAVINSLSTLAFDYPKRSSFFRAELEHYLLLTKEQGFNPLALKGSYAGAMGIPQFIASSYRNYAVDFNNDGVIDIWNSAEDAIGSVGNYFKQHGWQAGKPVAVQAMVKGEKFRRMVTDDLKPAHSNAELNSHDISSAASLPPETRAKFLVLENRNSNEYWLGFDNFYVITRYNHSALYAMAVYQLAGEIRTLYENEPD